MSSPEVSRVYVGSFWDQKLQNSDNAELFELEEKDLMRDLAVLPRQSAVRKINELVKRIRKVKTLAYIIGHLKAQMPALVGKEKKQKKLINDLPNGSLCMQLSFSSVFNKRFSPVVLFTLFYSISHHP